MWCIHAVEYYTTTNEIMPLAATWMDLEIIILSIGNLELGINILKLLLSISILARLISMWLGNAFARQLLFHNCFVFRMGNIKEKN